MLASHVNLMSARAEGMVGNSVRALFTRDAALARSVVEQDADLDRLEKESDRRCLNILARRSPVGEDLRFVTAVFKVVTDLERIGDLAVNIAERGLDLAGSVGIDAGPEVEALAAKVTVQLAEAVRAFAERDAVAARGLYAEDAVIDSMNRAAFSSLLGVARSYPDQIERALAISSICKHLERIGDHAVNIGEHAVFLVEGHDVRHGG
jgi:phosphate transport system protein